VELKENHQYKEQECLTNKLNGRKEHNPHGITLWNIKRTTKNV